MSINFSGASSLEVRQNFNSNLDTHIESIEESNTEAIHSTQKKDTDIGIGKIGSQKVTYGSEEGPTRIRLSDMVSQKVTYGSRVTLSGMDPQKVTYGSPIKLSDMGPQKVTYGSAIKLSDMDSQKVRYGSGIKLSDMGSQKITYDPRSTENLRLILQEGSTANEKDRRPYVKETDDGYYIIGGPQKRPCPYSEPSSVKYSKGPEGERISPIVIKDPEDCNKKNVREMNCTEELTMNERDIEIAKSDPSKKAPPKAPPDLELLSENICSEEYKNKSTTYYEDKTTAQGIEIFNRIHQTVPVREKHQLKEYC